MDGLEAQQPEDAAQYGDDEPGARAADPGGQRNRDQIQDGKAPGVAGRVVEQGDQDRENEGEGEGQRAVIRR